MNNNRQRRMIRQGLTLVELMIVIAILAMLLAVVAPMLQPVLQSQRMRESARVVNTQLMAAQSQAISRERPYGIWIERNENFPEMGLDVFMAEVPLPYSGDSDNARAVISSSGKATLNGASMIGMLEIGQGDLIRFNYQGAYYQITSASGQEVNFTHPSAAPPPQTQYGMPFQIYRRPTKAYGKPVRMPSQTCIDIAKSGIGASGTFSGAQGPIVIMFGPSGKLETIYVGGQPVSVTGSVFLLVGEIKEFIDNGSCLSSGDSRWVTINCQTGRSYVTENDKAGGDVTSCRSFARSGNAMQGN